MTTDVGSYISPVDPVAKAAVLHRNARRGWEMQPGASSIEEGFILRAHHPTAPLWKPPGEPLRSSRPSGWAPLWIVLGSVVSFAAALGWVTR